MAERQYKNNLTPQQMRVARLAAEGLPNKAIAAELGISLYTVKRHMQNIMAKLGVDGRAAVGAWVGRMEVLGDGRSSDDEEREGDEPTSPK